MTMNIFASIVIVIMALLFASGIKFKKSGGKNSRAISSLLLLMSSLCGISLLFITGVVGTCAKSKGPELFLPTYESTRTLILGKYLASLRPGAKVLVITGSFSSDDKKVKESQLEGLKQGLEADCAIMAVENVEMEKNKSGIQIKDDPKKIDEIIDTHLECDLVVSLVGFPYHSNKMKLWDKPDGARPAIAVADGNITTLGKYISDGRVCAAVIYRPFWTYDPVVPEDDLARFEQRYLMLTPENIQDYARSYRLRFHRPKD